MGLEAESSLRIIDCPCQLKGYGELARVAVQPRIRSQSPHVPQVRQVYRNLT